MIRLLKRLAILAGLWLGVTVAGVVYVNTRAPERRAADVEAAFAPAMAVATTLDGMIASLAGPPAAPLPPDDVMRAETEAARAETARLYDELIATHQALQEAHEDQWEKRWAGDAVTIARIAREQALEDIDRYVAKASDSTGLEIARDSARGQKDYVLGELADAREQLRAGQNAP